MTLYDLQKLEKKVLLSTHGTSATCTGIMGRLQAILLDTALSQVSCHSFDTVTVYNAPAYPYPQYLGIKTVAASSKIVSISNTKMFAAGFSAVNYSVGIGKTVLLNVVINGSYNVIGSSVVGSSLSNVSYFDYNNYVSVRRNDIISVGCLGNDFQYPGIAQPQSTKIVVAKYDTLGNLIWKTQHGGNMFYRPYTRAHTSDGGCIVGGWRFDTTTMKNPDIWESFLLKLDSHGNINTTGLEDIGKHDIAWYPNPVTSYVQFRVLPDTKSDITIINATGNVIYHSLITVNESSIDLTLFPAGVYFYLLQSGGKYSAGKLIKITD
jgi:hypothetical protein